jgi:hypothetical protein
MITPVKLDLTIYQGSTFRCPIVWATGEDEESAIPVDISGARGRMQIRKNRRDPDHFIELTTENGRIDITDPSNGLLHIQICAPDTAALDFKKGVYDLEIIFADCEVYRLCEGSVTLVPEITR